MANCTLKCEVITEADGSCTLRLLVAGLSLDEARVLGDILHDPVGKAVELAVKGRWTDDSHIVSTRGRTQ